MLYTWFNTRWERAICLVLALLLIAASVADSVANDGMGAAISMGAASLFAFFAGYYHGVIRAIEHKNKD